SAPRALKRTIRKLDRPPSQGRSAQQPYEVQKHHGADGRGDHLADDVDGVEPRQAQQPAADEGADDADHDVEADAESPALHDQRREPAGDAADDDEYDQSRNMHDPSPWPVRPVER